MGEPQLEGSKRAFEQALNVLHKTPVEHQIVREYEAGGSDLHESERRHERHDREADRRERPTRTGVREHEPRHEQHLGNGENHIQKGTWAEDSRRVFHDSVHAWRSVQTIV